MAQSPESIAITKRFFEVLRDLIEAGVLHGKKTFTDKYDIGRWNFNKVEKDPESLSVQLSWLAALINDYDVSAEWLMTGRGGKFSGLKTLKPLPWVGRGLGKKTLEKAVAKKKKDGRNI